MVQPVRQRLAPCQGLRRQALVVQARPFWALLLRALCLLALRDAGALPGLVILAQGGALVGREGAHYVAVQDLQGRVSLLVVAHGAGIGLIDRAARAAGAAGLRPGSLATKAQCKGEGGCARAGHFRLMVVFTPWCSVLSSNQRSVTVLVCV